MKRLAAIVVALLGIVTTLLYWFGVERRPSVDVSEVAGRAPQSEGRDSAEPGATEGVEARPADAGEPPLWRAVDETSVGQLPFFAEEWSSEGRALVRVTGASAAAQGWQVGDRLTIPLPQTGETYRPIIDAIDDGPGYSRAALAKVLDDDGYSRRVVVTVGPESMFAYIDTSAGPYELVAGSDYGWLLPTTSMMAGFDFSQPDYILPQDDSLQRQP